MRTGQRTLLQREPVLGDFDAERYVTEYRWAPARDGQKVPVAVVYRKDYRKDGTAPLLQYSYGSYGLSSDPAFSSAVLSLLDRGFVEERQSSPQRKLAKLVEEASIKFDLSPADGEFLFKFFREQKD